LPCLNGGKGDVGDSDNGIFSDFSYRMSGASWTVCSVVRTGRYVRRYTACTTWGLKRQQKVYVTLLPVSVHNLYLYFLIISLMRAWWKAGLGFFREMIYKRNNLKPRFISGSSDYSPRLRLLPSDKWHVQTLPNFTVSHLRNTCVIFTDVSTKCYDHSYCSFQKHQHAKWKLKQDTVNCLEKTSLKVSSLLTLSVARSCTVHDGWINGCGALVGW